MSRTDKALASELGIDLETLLRMRRAGVLDGLETEADTEIERDLDVADDLEPDVFDPDYDPHPEDNIVGGLRPLAENFDPVSLARAARAARH